MKAKDKIKMLMDDRDRQIESVSDWLDGEKLFRRLTVATKIRKKRVKLGLNQSEVAKMIGTRQQVISMMENAEYTPERQDHIELLNKICHALKINTQDLL